MKIPEIEISVLSDSEQWASGHNTDKYLITEKVLEELDNGVQPYNIERDFTQGKDWVKLEDNQIQITMDREYIREVVGKELTPRQFEKIKNLVEFSGCIAEYINSEIKEYIGFEGERFEKLADNYRAFGDC